MNSYQVMQNAEGQYIVNFCADGGKVVSLVCACQESAKVLAAHLDAMVKRAEVSEVCF